jgi:hypothetical protein
MNNSLPNPAGGNTNLVGSLSLMGKTTLFSRVAISPNAATTKAGDKSAISNIQKPTAKDSDYDTNASTSLGNTQPQLPLGKTLRSSTCTSTFKETIQKGVHSGVGILKK